MARKLTKKQREEYTELALRWTNVGVTKAEIARRLKVSRKTVYSLLEGGRASVDLDVDAANATSLSQLMEIQKTAWTAIKTQGRELASGGFVPKMHPNSLAALLRLILDVQTRKDKLHLIDPADRLEVTHKPTPDELRAMFPDYFKHPAKNRLRLVDENFDSGTG